MRVLSYLSDFSLCFYFYQILISDQIGADQGIGRLDVGKPLTEIRA
ncbi:MAG: hypothetical protein OER04_16050 [Cyclobacteriaceae bacterium]|nr:hypothetical protein [Cyclobacteriaceae bacterium]